MAIIYNAPAAQPLQPLSKVPKELDNRLGKGLFVPLSLNQNRYATRQGVDKVKQDIWVALCTPTGRRWGQPDFGSDLIRLVHEVYGPEVKAEMIRMTEDCLRAWIPQILIESVTVDESDLNNNQLSIVIVFMIKGANAFSSFKVPVTLEEGMKFPPSFFTVSGAPIFPRVNIGTSR